MYISIISILAAPRKLEHQGCHGTIVPSVQVELDAITTHSKINVDNLVIDHPDGKCDLENAFCHPPSGNNDEHWSVVCSQTQHRLSG